MANPVRNSYLESEILNADPLKLVVLLYRGAIDAVASARCHLREGKIRERSRAITRASGIINELLFSLNREAGGEIARNLAGLYAYMLSRLLEANAKQTEDPLVEVERLLAKLLEGWQAALVRDVPKAHSAAREPVSATY